MPKKLTHWFKEEEVNKPNKRFVTFLQQSYVVFCLYFICLYFGTCILFVSIMYVLPSLETKYLFFMAMILGISINNVVTRGKNTGKCLT